jgi:hypothetical protein
MASPVSPSEVPDFPEVSLFEITLLALTFMGSSWGTALLPGMFQNLLMIGFLFAGAGFGLYVLIRVFKSLPARWNFAGVLLPLIILLTATLACAGSTPPAPSPSPVSPSTTSPSDPRGNRILGIDVNPPADDDYDAAVTLAKQAGAQATPLSIYWDDFETAPGVYQPDQNWLAIANRYYPAQKLKLSLTISVIDTTENRLPDDLKGKTFDDPEVTARFQAFLDYVFTQIPEVDLITLSIGNEVDIYLSETGEWEAYTTFYQAALDHLQETQPDLPLGVKATLPGLLDTHQDKLAVLNQGSDVILVTYYPLEDDFTVQDPTVVHDDFEALVNSYPDRPLLLLEAGYPSSEVCDSSEIKQAAFIQELFAAWDTHRDHIQMVSISWLTDLSKSTTNDLQAYYRINNKAFGEYLRTLGLRTHPGAGEDKEAFQALREEARARGW